MSWEETISNRILKKHGNGGLSALLNEADAQKNLGALYFNGDSVQKDYREAAKWFLQAARQGDADAQYSLGLIYDQGGHGIEPDRKEALTWYLKAAEQGHEEAKQKLNKADSGATAK